MFILIPVIVYPFMLLQCGNRGFCLFYSDLSHKIGTNDFMLIFFCAVVNFFFHGLLSALKRNIHKKKNQNDRINQSQTLMRFQATQLMWF